MKKIQTILFVAWVTELLMAADPSCWSGGENGALQIAGLTFRLRNVSPGQVISAYGIGTRRCRFSATLPEEAELNSAGLGTVLDFRRFLYRPLLLDGTEYTFPEPYRSEERLRFADGTINRLEIALDNGKLVVSGGFRVRLEDRRGKLRRNYAVLTLLPPLGQRKLELVLEYQERHTVPIRLGTVANMGFRDEVAADRQGGWTDQGRENDLPGLKYGRQNLRGVNFEIEDPAHNGGKSCLAMRGKARPWFLKSREIPVGEIKGRYLYLLHALAWEPEKELPAGNITAEFTDGERHTISVFCRRDVGNFWFPADRDNGVVAWRGRNSSCDKIGLYASCFDLGRTGTIRRLIVESAENSIWMIVAMSLGEEKIPLKPGKELEEIIVEGAEYRPLYPAYWVKSGSILDFSDMNEAPSGRYGFVHAKGENLEFTGRPGIPCRFYGVNICLYAFFSPKPLLMKMAEHIAQSGYNLVRLHQFDRQLPDRSSGVSTEPDRERLDRLDFLIAELKKRGVYVTMDLFMLRDLEKGELSEFPDRAITFSEMKALLFVSAEARRNYRRFAANLLNHVNPYTGLAWKDDPVFVSISLVNENTIDQAYRNAAAIQPIFRRRFEKEGRGEEERLAWELFLDKLQQEYHQDLTGFLKELGVKALITDQNYSSSPRTSLRRNMLELIENHTYWSHPEFLNVGWKLPAQLDNRTPIEGLLDRGRTNVFSGSFNRNFHDRLLGKPFALSEWDYVNPNDFAAEGALLTASYAALQNWNILARFDYVTWGGSLMKERDTIGFFDILHDPMRLLSERAGRVLFERGDVSSARMTLPFVLNPEAMRQRGNYPSRYPESYRMLGLVSRVGTVFAPSDKKAAFSFDGSTQFCLRLEERQEAVEMVAASDSPLAQYIDWKAGRFRSDTGELLIDCREKLFEVTTPRSEGAILDENARFAGKVVSLENKKGRNVVFVTSRDGQPLLCSRRILLLHLTENKNSGMRFSNEGRKVLLDWGKLPLLVRNGTVRATLCGDYRKYRLYAVGVSGQRMFRITPVLNDGKVLMFDMEVHKNPKLPALVYELVKE